jgi:hypothetical protein
MCSPTVALTAVSQGAGLFGKQQAANAQYAAAKNQRQQVVNQQRSKLTLDTARYHRKQADRERADMSAVRAGEEAYLGNQRKYNEKVNAFMVNKQNRLIKSLEASGQMGARGQRGGSADMMQIANSAATGRDTATALAMLRSSATSLIADNRGIRNKVQGEFESNYSQIGDKPIQGFEPPEVAKPQGVGIMDIVGAAASVGMSGISAAGASKTLPGGQSLKMMGGGDPLPGAFSSGGLQGSFPTNVDTSFGGGNFGLYDSGINFTNLDPLPFKY